MKSVSLKIIFAKAILITLTVMPAFGAPMITSMSGTTTKGSTITVNGTGFGIKNPAQPLVWADFETGSVISSPALSTGTLLTNDLSITTTGQEPGSIYSVRGMPWDGTIKNNPRLYTSTSTGQDKFFLSVKRKYDHPTFWSGVTNYKFTRHWPTCSTGYTNLVGTYFLGSPPLGLHTTNEGTTATTKMLNGTPNVQTWLQEEYQAYQGTIDTPDAQFKMWQNGSLLFTWAFVGRSTTYPNIWQCFDVENYFTINPPPAGAYVYFDDFYFDTTWSRIMIGNQATFSASTHREIQIPTSWSETSITFVLNQGSFPNLANAHVYVFDSNGTVNENGYPLCPSCSKPPVNVSSR